MSLMWGVFCLVRLRVFRKAYGIFPSLLSSKVIPRFSRGIQSETQLSGCYDSAQHDNRVRMGQCYFRNLSEEPALQILRIE
jgi:hypothetical protein